MAQFHIANTLKCLPNLRNLSSIRRDFTVSRVIYNKPLTGQSQSSPKIPDVKGLSARVIHPTNDSVGPGASKNSNYKNPEYFSYDKSSFFEAEVEMASYRCPQPSNKKK